MQLFQATRATGVGRALLIGSLVLGGTTVVAGCGGSGSSRPASSSGPTAASSSAASSAAASSAASASAVTAGAGAPGPASGSPARPGSTGPAAGVASTPGRSGSLSAAVRGGGATGDGSAVSGSDAGGRLVTATHAVTSPSGRYVAALAPAAVTGGVQTYVVVIRDATAKEVFRDTAAYSADQGLAVAWLSGQDQLWLQSEIATSHLDRVGAAWRETAITPATVDTIPAEIKALTD